jgi:DNA invertase Pin-like site-specific DNA recombinase
MKNKIYAYVRVSTQEQNLDRQIEAIKEYVKENNIELSERDIISDKASGKDFKRTGYESLINTMLRSGDTLIIKELDRLGRNYEQMKDEWNKLVKNGIDIIVIDTPMLSTANKTDLDKTLISNIVFELLAYTAQKEKEMRHKRQTEGISIAKDKGIHLGRPKATFPDKWDDVYKQWKLEEITANKAMELLGMKRTTFYKLVKEQEGK